MVCWPFDGCAALVACYMVLDDSFYWYVRFCFCVAWFIAVGLACLRFNLLWVC